MPSVKVPRLPVLVMAALVVALAPNAFAPNAFADTPTCDDIVQDPTIATCSCLCNAGTLYPGCIGLAEGSAASTPGQCPDMLQGRRVLSAGDAFVAADPVIAGSGTNARTYLFQAMNDPSNPGLGIVDGNAVSIITAQVPCQQTSTPFPQQTRFARLFDLPYDMLVTLKPVGITTNVKTNCFATNASATNVRFTVQSSNSGAPTVQPAAFGVNPQWLQLAVDDFNYDGFDDIVLLNIDSIQIWTAVDPEDPGKGITREGQLNTKQGAAFTAPINEPATGDFNGDGLVDVAWIGGNFPNKTGTLSVYFATICPGPVVNTLCEGASAFQLILDPASKLFPGVSGATSTIVLPKATLSPTPCGVVQSARTQTTTGDSLRAGAIAVGNFESNGHNPRGGPIDELVVAYVSGDVLRGSNGCEVDVQYWSYATPEAAAPGWAQQRGKTIANLLPQVKDPSEFYTTFAVFARSAYLDWYGLVEQAVIGVTANNPDFEGTTANRQPTFYMPATASVSGTGDQAEISVCAPRISGGGDGNSPWAFGMAVGRLSTAITDDTSDSGEPDACSDFADAEPGQCPYNPQIGMLIASDQKTDNVAPPQIQLYAVRPSEPGGNDDNLKCADPSVTGYLPVLTQVNGISGYDKPFVTLLRGGSLLQAGDAFGNSVRVGAPLVTRVSAHTSPQIVIEAPPSLVDYVQPNEQDATTPAVVNFTRQPANYQTQIQFGKQKTDTASTQRTTSYTSSTSETISGEWKFGAPLVGTIDIKNKESWSQFHENTTNHELSTYSTTRLQTAGAIGADDQVFWTQTTFNVFHFPVLGVTNCPATTTCSEDDPGATGCTAAASGVALTCAVADDGCHCLSDGAADAMCPALPADTGSRSCAEEDGDVCCSLLPQQLRVSFSGPEEVTRASSAGAAIEWYQPKHEPAQILSYPSSVPLLVAREAGGQRLANLDPFSTGTNDTLESVSWTCGTSTSVSTGNTTRHSFDSDTSITAGTNKIAMEEAGKVGSFDFDYQSSDSLSHLNTHTVGQITSTSVGLLLQGAGFFDVDQYAYSVAGTVLGQTRPEAVLDNPNLKVCPVDDVDCSTADQVQADCTTTGPLRVAFAADPTTNVSGAWWSSTSPYLKNIDVALNNPSRWRRVGQSQVADTALQCRGPANMPICYTSNQPPTGTSASDVWDALFYAMKGLLVTTGGTAGPLRTTAVAGDEVFLQARVYNYSLRTMDPGTRVYARFYRQQLDVNNQNGSLSVVDYATDADGNPLPAVPIGPTGLGDGDPIQVISPADGSATISPFNNTTDPSRDNISLATTSYVAEDADACEYEDGMQSCNGAYFAYWVTVWAEGADGNVLSELSGHGLGAAFDPDTSYRFITDVPLARVGSGGSTASYANNVGLFRLLFSIVRPDDGETLTASSATSARSLPTLLSFDRLNVSREEAVLGEPVVVSAQVVWEGAEAPGATVVFSDGDPQNGGVAFDAEWLPRIRPFDRHFVRVNYNPETCGRHEIYADVTGESPIHAARGVAVVDVGIDLEAAIRFLIGQVKALPSSGWVIPAGGNRDSHTAHPHEDGLRPVERLLLVFRLLLADVALRADRTANGIRHLERFTDAVERYERRGKIDAQPAGVLIAESNQIIGCSS